MKSSKRKRPPDDPDFEAVTPRLASLRLRPRKQLRVAPAGEVVSKTDSEPEREDPSGTWRPIRQRQRDVFGHVLCEDAMEYSSLLLKLPEESRHAMDRVLGEEYTRKLSSGNSLQELLSFNSWFIVHTRKPQVKIERSLSDLREFPHVQEWSRYSASVLEMNAVKARLKKLKAERKKKTWKPREERATDEVTQEIKKEEAPLDVEKELMLFRTRKYRLFLTKEQKEILKWYMGTCR